MKDIIIIRAGGPEREILGFTQPVNKGKPRWHVKGFYDDDVECGKFIHGLPILGKVGDLNTQQESFDVAIAIGDPSTRRKVYGRLNEQHLSFPTLISPDATILDGRGIFIGEGVLCCVGTILIYDITIGASTLLNLCYMVGHDAVIEPFCSFMSSVNISGETYIRVEIYMGTGSSVINRISIGKNTTIGADAVATKDIPADCVVARYPARSIGFKS